MKQRIISMILLYTLITVAGCSFLSETPDETVNWSAQKLYTEARAALNSGDYTTAIKYYELLESRYPFERFAQQAQIDIIYTYYKSEEPESAIAAADRFIKLYPRHPNVDYVYYLKGLVSYELNTGFFDRFLPLDRSQRDQNTALRSFDSFSTLVTNFPNSKYSEDARYRMLFLRNNMAEYELHVARFYLKRGAYLAAANRAKKVIESYQRTPAVPEALVILAKSYKIMGLNDLTADTLKVLKANYPDHQGIGEVERLAVK